MRKIILLFFSVMMVLQAKNALSEQALHEINLSLPVLIDVLQNSSGSGVFVRGDKGMFVITAGHVLYGKDDKNNDYLRGRTILLTAHTTSNEITKIELDIPELAKGDNFKYDSANDVAVIRLLRPDIKNGDDVKGVKILALPQDKSQIGNIPLDYKDGFPTSGIRYFKDVKVSNYVYVFGYPTSLTARTKSFERDRPLVRKGIVAGKYPGKKRIIIDSPAYQGNSGGPVLMVDGNKILPIGIVTELIPLVEEWKNSIYGISNLSISNSGYSVVIPMDFIVDLIGQF